MLKLWMRGMGMIWYVVGWDAVFVGVEVEVDVEQAIATMFVTRQVVKIVPSIVVVGDVVVSLMLEGGC